MITAATRTILKSCNSLKFTDACIMNFNKKSYLWSMSVVWLFKSIWYSRSQHFMNKTWTIHTEKNIFEILLDHTEITLYLSFSDWFGRANGHCLFAVPNQSKNGKYNILSVWSNKISKRFLWVIQRFLKIWNSERTLSVYCCKSIGKW